MGDHSLVHLWSLIHPDGQDVPLIHSPRGTESCTRTTLLREGHLLEPVLMVEECPEMVPMLWLEEPLNDR